MDIPGNHLKICPSESPTLSDSIHHTGPHVLRLLALKFIHLQMTNSQSRHNNLIWKQSQSVLLERFRVGKKEKFDSLRNVSVCKGGLSCTVEEIGVDGYGVEGI